MMNHIELVELNLLDIISELEKQHEIGKTFPSEQLSFEEQIEQLREFILDAAEYGIAYESLVSLLSSYDFILTGKSSVKLLEAGLLMKFKTELPEDSIFDNR